MICARWTWRTGKDCDLAHCSKVFRCSLLSTTGGAHAWKGLLIIKRRISNVISYYLGRTALVGAGRPAGVIRRLLAIREETEVVLTDRMRTQWISRRDESVPEGADCYRCQQPLDPAEEMSILKSPAAAA